jgi:hypothetical protein
MKRRGIYACGTCGNKTEFIQKTIPYAMKLWMEELEAMTSPPEDGDWLRIAEPESLGSVRRSPAATSGAIHDSMEPDCPNRS